MEKGGRQNVESATDLDEYPQARGDGDLQNAVF